MGSRLIGAAAALALGWSLAVHAQDGSTFAAADWPFIGGDWTNSRYSALDQINTATVSDLGAVWSMRFEGGATTRATPVIKDGVMYIGSGTRPYAINAVTGERLWTIRPDQDAPTSLETAGSSSA
jgi:glucose dehydrogenase